MNPPPDKRFYQFGDFRLDKERHRVTHNNVDLPLTHNAVEILLVLIERRGEVVEREKLMNAVWPDIAVEDGNLSVTVSMLRRVLGKHCDEKFIETFPKRGYKFVGDVSEVSEPVSGVVVAKHRMGRVVIDEELGLMTWLRSLLMNNSRRRSAVAALVVAVLALGLGTWFYFSRPSSARGEGGTVKSIAVLPFKSIGAEGGEAHHGLGLADILITRLSNIRDITVRPTSAIMLFENAQESSATIGRKLLVDAVLEGSILQANGRVRVTVRLIRVDDQSSLWGGQFEKSATDQLQLQDEIALQVVHALALSLTGTEEKALTKRYTLNQDALQLYLKGRYHWNKRNHEGLSEAAYLFRQAIEADPQFALAYVGLADSYVFAGGASPELNNALATALELDPNLGEAYATKGFVLSLHSWRWREAEEAFKKAIELNPGYATSHHWYATLLGIEGRYDEARAEMHRALEINPMSHNFLADLGQIYYFNREYDKAKEYCDKALAIYPEFTFAHGYLSHIQLKRGEYESAIEERIKGIYALSAMGKQPPGYEQRAIASYIESYRKGGIKGLFEGVLKEERELVTRDPSQPYGVAIICSILDNEDKALDNLEKALENRAFMMAWVKSEPIFDNLRKHPRFKAILQKMNLPPDA